ncbi:MAG TPA: hypothetical protein PLP29_12890 [Candidatus Ozemobacteraceae bacterium]|nr:hypothetical protein [Candidatus Ozemobacteraceae bacterium]
MNPAPPFATGIPPWDAPCWLVLDQPALLGNVPAAEGRDWVADLRSPILARSWRQVAPELKRRGGWGYISRGFRLTGPAAVAEEGWIRLLAPPASSGSIAEAVRNGFHVTVGQTSEAIVASNAAQACNRRVSLLIRVRSGELMADPGPTGCMSLLEALPGLAAVDIAGFWLDEPFGGRQECDLFMRAAGRLLGDIRALVILGAGAGPVPARLKSVPQIGRELFGYAKQTIEPMGLTATLTLEGWAYPLRTRGRGLLAGVDLGAAHGLPRQARGQVVIGGESGRIVAIEERRLIIELARRPAVGTPWRALLLGSHDTQTVPADEWPDHEELTAGLDRLARECPLYIRRGAELLAADPFPGGV